MKHKTKIAAVSVAAVMACGIFAGCDLVTTDSYKDYEQVIAEVDITKGEHSDFASLKGVIETADITKRDMVASFAASGSQVMSQYGWTYKDTFDAICDSLINRQVYVQYAKAYFLTNDDAYTAEGYRQATKDKQGVELAVASLEYFLDETEEAKTLYDLRVSFNSSLDTIEQNIVEEDEDDHDETVRTTPTGVETEDEDYCDPNYRIFTGTQRTYGSYERIEGSTASTRRQAYATFLSNLRSSGLLIENEDTSDIEKLSYFRRELKSAYEAKLVEKLTDRFEKQAEAAITDEVNDAWLTSEFNALKTRQKSAFAATDGDTQVSSALDSMSDTSFVLTAPRGGYGFVINILLPFSTTQTQRLNDANMDNGDKKGNKFVTRASLLKNVKATDQRGTWFTGHDDYSFVGTDGYPGANGDGERKYLFFEDCLGAAEGDSKYEALKNYYGKYTFNGTVTPPAEGEGNGGYTVKPNKISVDDFIKEMNGYLTFALNGKATVKEDQAAPKDYYTKSVYDYYKPNAGGVKDGTGDVDYDAFIYYKGHVEFNKPFDANALFVKGSQENIALSVMNELSFAYNTDTAGLNSYLGYSVTPNKTNFVSEFEYAAQKVCAEGAGNFIVVPSDYGWHIIYCTFSFTQDSLEPFSYKASDRNAEGTFSNLYFEAKKSEAVSKYTSTKQNEIISSYAKESATIYEDRYADLSGLDTAS